MWKIREKKELFKWYLFLGVLWYFLHSRLVGHFTLACGIKCTFSRCLFFLAFNSFSSLCCFFEFYIRCASQFSVFVFTAMTFVQAFFLLCLSHSEAHREQRILHIVQTCGKLNFPYVKCWTYLHTICDSLLTRIIGHLLGGSKNATISSNLATHCIESTASDRQSIFRPSFFRPLLMRILTSNYEFCLINTIQVVENAHSRYSNKKIYEIRGQKIIFIYCGSFRFIEINYNE